MLKENIKNYSLEELKEKIENLGEKKYRAEQIGILVRSNKQALQ